MARARPRAARLGGRERREGGGLPRSGRGRGAAGGRRRPGRPLWSGRRVGLGGAAGPSCPGRWNNGTARGEGGWEEGARLSRKGETKEPFADCHLHVTRSPPLLSFFLLFRQLWASEGALCTQMLGFSSRLSPAQRARARALAVPQPVPATWGQGLRTGSGWRAAGDQSQGPAGLVRSPRPLRASHPGPHGGQGARGSACSCDPLGSAACGSRSRPGPGEGGRRPVPPSARPPLSGVLG